MIATTNLGFARMGAHRELKWALERAWRGQDPGFDDLGSTAAELRARHWRLQADHGVDPVPTGDFALYDHVLDTAIAVGAVPRRFGPGAGAGDGPEALESAFLLARGSQGVPALELTKWFDTNYHHLVPELEASTAFQPDPASLRGHLDEARAQGHRARPVLLGPVTFLSVAKRTDGGDPLDLLDALLEAYAVIVAELVAAGASGIQVDEPVLVTDVDAPTGRALRRSCTALREAAGTAELTLATYFGSLGPATELALSLDVDVVHVDLVAGAHQLEEVVRALPGGRSLSLGIVDGRNVWRTDLAALLRRLEPVVDRLGPERLRLAPSCSLLHLPVDLGLEAGLDAELASWLAFGVQRLDEVATVARALAGDPAAREAADASAAAVAARRRSPRVVRPAVRDRLARLGPADTDRARPSAERRSAHRQRLGLPVLPTTTIGSFPQTDEIRRLRRRFRTGELDTRAYEAGLEAGIADCVGRQEALGLDVLVHGELERTDMVEHFGARLEGFATTAHGWVQSYGSRCVKPPILFGDVARPEPMTVRWSTFAAGLTRRPVKAMLTGPVTILAWSFVRDDQPRPETARQVALALRDEVADLDAAGLPIVQIDEPALREGLPLRRAGRPAYLAWTTEAFRLAAAGAGEAVQVHTHLCYSQVAEILGAVVALGADVVSIEAARSRMELLDAEALRTQGAPDQLGPGMWDVHSPRVPSAEELDGLLERAIAVLGIERLWVNPDCGLKTRGWPEVEASLRALVGAAQRARERHR